jgi:hypothetical protein
MRRWRSSSASFRRAAVSGEHGHPLLDTAGRWRAPRQRLALGLPDGLDWCGLSFLDRGHSDQPTIIRPCDKALSCARLASRVRRDMGRFAGPVSMERSLKMERPLSGPNTELRVRARGLTPRRAGPRRSLAG